MSSSTRSRSRSSLHSTTPPPPSTSNTGSNFLDTPLPLAGPAPNITRLTAAPTSKFESLALEDALRRTSTKEGLQGFDLLSTTNTPPSPPRFDDAPQENGCSDADVVAGESNENRVSPLLHLPPAAVRSVPLAFGVPPLTPASILGNTTNLSRENPRMSACEQALAEVLGKSASRFPAKSTSHTRRGSRLAPSEKQVAALGVSFQSSLRPLTSGFESYRLGTTASTVQQGNAVPLPVNPGLVSLSGLGGLLAHSDKLSFTKLWVQRLHSEYSGERTDADRSSGDASATTTRLLPAVELDCERSPEERRRVAESQVDSDVDDDTEAYRFIRPGEDPIVEVWDDDESGEEEKVDAPAAPAPAVHKDEDTDFKLVPDATLSSDTATFTDLAIPTSVFAAQLNAYGSLRILILQNVCLSLSRTELALPQLEAAHLPHLHLLAILGLPENVWGWNAALSELPLTVDMQISLRLPVGEAKDTDNLQGVWSTLSDAIDALRFTGGPGGGIGSHFRRVWKEAAEFRIRNQSCGVGISLSCPEGMEMGCFSVELVAATSFTTPLDSSSVDSPFAPPLLPSVPIPPIHSAACNRFVQTLASQLDQRSTTALRVVVLGSETSGPLMRETFRKVYLKLDLGDAQIEELAFVGGVGFEALHPLATKPKMPVLFPSLRRIDIGIPTTAAADASTSTGGREGPALSKYVKYVIGLVASPREVEWLGLEESAVESWKDLPVPFGLFEFSPNFGGR